MEITLSTELTGMLDAGTYEWSQPPVTLNIGDHVNFETTLNGVTLSDWSVFKTEGDYTYIILDDYLPNTAVPAFDGKETSSTYNVYASSNRKQLIDGLSTKSLWRDIINNGKVNGVDLSSDIKNDLDNVWAMGSPTLEMFVDSWNTMYPEDKLYTAKRTGMSDSVGWGFYIGANENPTSTYISLLKEGYNNPLYFPHKSGVSNCYGYWLASPSATYESYVMNVSDNGNVHNIYYSRRYYSARPLVRVPSDILEKKKELPKIGDTVNYETTLNGQTLSNWKVFYNDEANGKTYIILDDYLPNNAVPAFTGKQTSNMARNNK